MPKNQERERHTNSHNIVFLCLPHLLRRSSYLSTFVDTRWIVNLCDGSPFYDISHVNEHHCKMSSIFSPLSRSFWWALFVASSLRKCVRQLFIQPRFVVITIAAAASASECASSWLILVIKWWDGYRVCGDQYRRRYVRMCVCVCEGCMIALLYLCKILWKERGRGVRVKSIRPKL